MAAGKFTKTFNFFILFTTFETFFDAQFYAKCNTLEWGEA